MKFCIEVRVATHDGYVWRKLRHTNGDFYTFDTRAEALQQARKCYPDHVEEEHWRIALVIK